MDKRKIATAIAVPALLAGACAWAASTNSLTMQHKISTGTVNISLEEYQCVNGMEEEYQNNQIIAPGQTISKIPEIKCLAEPCYVRCRITWGLPVATGDSAVLSPPDNYLRGINDGWIKTGDYWYYTKILSSGESIRVFNGVQPPADLADSIFGSKVDIIVSADAIQAVNFTPNFESDDPWHGSGEILEAWKARDGEKNPDAQESSNVKVFFEGDAGKMVTDADSLLHVFGEFMPGDVKEGKLLIQNTTSVPQKVYLAIGKPAQEEDSFKLLEKVNLTVSNDGDTIYAGSAAGLAETEELSLGLYLPGGDSTLRFNLEVPGNVDNSLALTDAKTAWTFRAIESKAEEETDTTKETTRETTAKKNNDGGKGVSSNKDTFGNDNENGSKLRVYAPKTGDDTYAIIVKFFTCMVVGFITMLTVRKRRRKHV